MPSAKFLATAFAAGLCACVAPAPGQTADAEVRLEGSGRHRDAMNAMQLKPFDTSILGHLTRWSGTPVTAETIKDKVLLLVTWTSYAKAANSPAVNLAQRMSDRYGGKGLVVAVIHNPRGFDSASTVASELGLKIPFAADEQGLARAALKVDQDPDFFLVDRAGNMRFADIDTAGVERAVEIAINETVQQAAAVPGAAARAAEERQREMLKSREVRGAVRPGQPLTVPFTPPPEEAYARARWPAVVTKTGVSQFDQVAGRIAKDKPAATMPDEGWLTPKPVPTGRVTLIYQLDPMDSEVSEIPDKMARLQEAFPRDLTVIGTVFESRDDGSLSEEEKAQRKRRRVEAMRELIRQRNLNHAFNAEPFKIGDQGLGDVVIPLASRRHFSIAYLVSTDGRCRWIGNQYWEGFDTVVGDFIEADPGVRARRKAEEAAAKAAGE